MHSYTRKMAWNSDPTIFRPLARCDHTVNQVRLNWNPELAGLPGFVSDKIDRFWKENVENTGRKSFIFNGQLGGVSGWRTRGTEFEFDLVLTEYKRLYFAKERYCSDANLIEQYNLAAVLGVSVFLISSDDHLILIERSSSVGEAPGKFDFIGGHIDPAAHLLDGIPNPFLAIREELAEEIGLDVPVRELRLSGLVTTVAPEKPEAFFLMRSQMSAREIISAGAEENCTEIARLFTIQNDADAIEQFTVRNKQRLSPSAYGGLLLYHQSLGG